MTIESHQKAATLHLGSCLGQIQAANLNIRQLLRLIRGLLLFLISFPFLKSNDARFALIYHHRPSGGRFFQSSSGSNVLSNKTTVAPGLRHCGDSMTAKADGKMVMPFLALPSS
jgi:hypothetical protein